MCLVAATFFDGPGSYRSVSAEEAVNFGHISPETRRRKIAAYWLLNN